MQNTNSSNDYVLDCSNLTSSQNKHRPWAASLPNATVDAVHSNEPTVEEPFHEAQKISRSIRTKIPSHLYRCLSDSALYLELNSGYPTPPYSNFAKYLPCLSTPSENSSETLRTDFSVQESGSSIENDFRLPISASQLSLPEPPDGGWGWVIVFAAFLVHMITEGVIVSFGIFIEDLAEEFQESMSATSWVGSFSYGIPALVTPISSVILDRFGCRVTCILGALISCVGCLIGSFANSLTALVFTFGIFSGLGFSLCMTSALVVVSVYFDELRATATGLSIAGTGVGALVFAPAVEFLNKIYTWRGTFMILAGAVLHMAVCGALMRPVETRLQKRHRQRLAWLEHFAKVSGLTTMTENSEYVDKDVLGKINLLRDRLLAPRKCSGRAHAVVRIPGEYFRNQGGIAVAADDKLKLSKCFNHRNTKSHHVCTNDVTNLPNTVIVQPLPIIQEGELLKLEQSPKKLDFGACDIKRLFASTVNLFISEKSKTSIPRYHTLPNLQRHCVTFSTPAKCTCTDSVSKVSAASYATHAISDLSKNNQYKHFENPVQSSAAVDHPPSVHSKQISIDSNNSLELFYKVSLLKAFGITRSSLCTALSLPDLSQVHRIRRKSDSTNSETSSSSSSTAATKCVDSSCCIWLTRYDYSDQDDENLDEDESWWTDICSKYCENLMDVDIRRCIRRLFDFRLFRRPMFNLFLLSNMLLYFWYNVTYFFMGVHAVNLGYSESRAALLFSILGGANMVGEIAVGLLADREWVDASTLYFLMLLMCGISTALVPVLTTFPLLSIYAALFGMGLASNDALCTVLLVEFVGLQQLTNGLGICFFCQGVANIFGPPTIGFIIDSTHSQLPAYIVSGIGLIFSGLVVIPIIVRRFRQRRARRLRRKQRQQLLTPTTQTPLGDA